MFLNETRQQKPITNPQSYPQARATAKKLNQIDKRNEVKTTEGSNAFPTVDPMTVTYRSKELRTCKDGLCCLQGYLKCWIFALLMLILNCAFVFMVNIYSV
jgi:hypothetical protein